MRAIDCWVNVNIGGQGRPEFLKAVAKDYFKQGEDFFRAYSIDEMVETMDRLGVERAILTTDPHHPDPHVMSFARKLPERFALAAQIDPRKVMKSVRALESFVRDEGAVLARITPFALDLPPNHALYYPIYTKCVELGLPAEVLHPRADPVHELSRSAQGAVRLGPSGDPDGALPRRGEPARPAR